jgi:tRNA pseudouridine38-40 synthase
MGWYHRRLDLERMREAAASLVGTHDFSAFRSAECQADSPVRELRRFDIERHEDLIVLRVAANAFLQRMVRNLVGTMIYVGNGNFSPQWARQVLDGRDRSRAAPTFAPDGLYLSGVEYDPCWALPMRAPAALEALTATA